MEIMGICRNLVLKICETTSPELIFGGFKPFKTTLYSNGLYQGQKSPPGPVRVGVLSSTNDLTVSGFIFLLCAFFVE